MSVTNLVSNSSRLESRVPAIKRPNLSKSAPATTLAAFAGYARRSPDSSGAMKR